MFEKFIQWRIENKVDTILVGYEFPEAEAVMNEYQHGFFGVDKIGRPLYVDRAGSVNVNKIFKITSEERIIKEMIHLYEDMMKVKFMACSELYDRQITQSFNIFDAGGFGLS